MTLTPVITEHWDQSDLYTIDGYRRVGGYRALEKALKQDPDAIINSVKDSGLRGRGGGIVAPLYSTGMPPNG